MTMLNPWSSMAQQPSPSEVVTEEITINADSASTNSVATYKGGYNALLTALAKNIQYPAECAEANIQGKVVLRIGVDENGKSADITVLRSVHPALDAEAKRAASLLTDWIPGTEADGHPITTYFALPVNFRLQAAPPEPIVYAHVDSVAWQQMLDLATKEQAERNYPYAKSYLREAFYINPYDFLPIDRILTLNKQESVKGEDEQVLEYAIKQLQRITSANGPHLGVIPVYEEIINRMQKVNAKNYSPQIALASVYLGIADEESLKKCFEQVDKVLPHINDNDDDASNFIYLKVPMYLIYIQNHPQLAVDYLAPKLKKHTKDKAFYRSFELLSDACSQVGATADAEKYAAIAAKLAPPKEEPTPADGASATSAN